MRTREKLDGLKNGGLNNNSLTLMGPDVQIIGDQSRNINNLFDQMIT